MRSSNERGIALITVLLVMMLMSALLVGFTAVVISDQRYRFIDQDRGQAFYAASAGVEKLTTDLGNLFFVSVAPTKAQLLAVTAKLPVIARVTFASPMAAGNLPTSSLSATSCVSPNAIATVGTNGYTIKFCAAPGGNPTAVQPPKPIKSGPYEGLVALQTPYQMDVTARTASGGETHLVRSMESVAIPVFQFGMFSDVDLSFFAGPDFDFGGRVHTNGNLFLAEGDGTLTLTDRVTAAKQVVRQRLQNGVSIDTSPAHRGTVNVAKGPGQLRALARDEGSVTDGLNLLGLGVLNSAWQTTSISVYNTWLRNGATGAKPLNLALLTVGGSNPDLIRRPVTATENVTNPVLFGERLYTKASVRILLSDTSAKITGLPGVTAVPPVLLDGDWNTAVPNNGTAYGPIEDTHPPIARSPGAHSATIQMTAVGSATLTATANLPVYFQPVPITAYTSSAGGKNGKNCKQNKGKKKGKGKDIDDGKDTGCVPIFVVMQCTGRTPASFTGCPPLTLALPDDTEISGVLNGVFVTTTVDETGAGKGNGKGKTLPVGSTTIPVTDSAAFAPTTFWVDNTIVQCTGNTLTALTGCAGTPAGGTSVKTNVLSGPGIGLVGGYIKIEKQAANGTWTDVTMELLNYGIGDNNLQGDLCGDPTPSAIVRLQRLHDNPVAGGTCNYDTDDSGALDPTNWWPNVLFDPREGLVRDTGLGGVSNLPLGGVMHYITVDISNLSKWFAGTGAYSAGTGASSRTENGGYTVYFSDRRNNRNAAGQETGEYGWEDFVNPVSSAGTPNGVLDTGEDVNARFGDPAYVPVLDTYGSLPNYTVPAAAASIAAPPGAVAPLDVDARPATLLNRGQAQVNRAVLFRHALKLTNGQDIAGQGITGLTIVSENPVYIQGNWNANGTFAGAHAATSVIADAVTLLTSDWKDTVSFTSPYDTSGRPNGVQSWYRVAIIAGKGMAFPQPSGTATDFGTDGGTHNFLRHLQNGNQAVNYRGSIATFYYNRQAVGTYKCCNTVYGAPDRKYSFDTDFLNPALLPPNTPLFRDLNAVGFAQDLRPGR